LFAVVDMMKPNMYLVGGDEVEKVDEAGGRGGEILGDQKDKISWKAGGGRGGGGGACQTRPSRRASMTLDLHKWDKERKLLCKARGD
jgi:hypothetical protein